MKSLKSDSVAQGQVSCPFCNIWVSFPTYLLVHVQKFHDGRKYFNCQVCGQGFSRRKYLAQHLIIHAVEKPSSDSSEQKQEFKNEELSSVNKSPVEVEQTKEDKCGEVSSEHIHVKSNQRKGLEEQTNQNKSEGLLSEDMYMESDPAKEFESEKSSSSNQSPVQMEPREILENEDSPLLDQCPVKVKRRKQYKRKELLSGHSHVESDQRKFESEKSCSSSQRPVQLDPRKKFENKCPPPPDQYPGVIELKSKQVFYSSSEYCSNQSGKTITLEDEKPSEHSHLESKITDDPESENPSTSENCFTSKQTKKIEKHAVQQLQGILASKKIQLQNHVIQKSDKLHHRKLTRSLIQSRAKIYSNGRIHSCVFCHHIFPHNQSLFFHLLSHIKEKPWFCGTCGNEFSRNANLLLHLRGHQGNISKPYSCSTCQRSFARKEHLTNHARMHTGEKPFSCVKCDRKFSRQDNLRVHVQTHKSNNKPYFCEICDNSFSRKSILKEHLKTHTGVKPYTCDKCNSSFAQKTNLKIHHVSVHSKDKPYCCSSCSEKFITRANLNNHKKKNHPTIPPEAIHGSTLNANVNNSFLRIPCMFCKITCQDEHSLKCHLRWHTFEQPFFCPVCKDEFPAKGMMLEHLKYVCQKNRTSSEKCCSVM